MQYLKINGTDVSQYIKSLGISHEPVWSENAGRTITAEFVGDIIAKKWKLTCATKPLTQSQISQIMNLLESNAFLTVGFIPPNNNSDSIQTITCYVNAPNTNVYTYVENLVRYSDLTFNLIQK